MNRTEEIRALDQLAERLHARFPDAPEERIRTLVAEAHQVYDGRPIRDFIPVLVERDVVDLFRVPAQRSRSS